MGNLWTNRLQSLPPATDAAPSSRPRAVTASGVRSAVKYAFHGLRDAWLDEPNLRLHAIAGISIVAAGFYCRLVVSEWLWLTLAVGLVVFAEMLNSAIERIVDLVVGLRPDPVAREVKDMAAAFVLVAALVAGIVALLIFIPHLS